MILVSLDNIQDALEDPFDSRGEDDIVVDAGADYDRLTDTRGAAAPSLTIGAGA